MDPNVAADIMRDESVDIEDRSMALEDLEEWLIDSGFPPVIYGPDGKRIEFPTHEAQVRAAYCEINRYRREFARLAPDGVDRRPCVCGHPQAEGVLHRTDGPCFHVARSETGTLDEGGAL